MSPGADGRRQRILVLIKGLGIGGAERLISEGSGHWDTEEFQYRVAYVLPWKDQLVAAVEQSGVEVNCVGGRRGLDPTTPLRLRRLESSFRPDLVHAHLPSAGILARAVTTRPIVYTEHNVAASYRQPTRTLNRLTYWRNSVVIAVSDAVADSLSGYPGPDPVVVPNGVSPIATGSGDSIRSELGIDGRSPLIVHVGNIRPHKGHVNLIEATVHLQHEVPEARVVSIGAEKHEGDLRRLRQLAADAGVSDLIQFLGRRANATDFLSAADVVVNPSDYEGLPVTVLEALSLGRPVVATDVGGVGSVVIHDKTGLLVPPKEPAALARALAVAIKSPHASAWGHAGAEMVAARHGLPQMIRAYEDIYRSTLRHE